MKLKLPSVVFIERLHHAIIELYGGKEGTLHRHVLETVIARPKNYISYDDTNLHKACAVMLHTIAQDHPFTDANKRTALITAIYTYRLNDVFLDYGDEELNSEVTSLLLWIVQEKPNVDDIIEQLQEIVKYSDILNTIPNKPKE